MTAEGFAGDDALLVEIDFGDSVSKTVLVRKGDVGTEVYRKPVACDSAIRALGVKAASRL
ncbi:hypothetical protein AB0M36_16095 [Actinoplanes sp. NPDC051346]|uniref:hypothetical protein n=1 Tax=Actinoplanes sp. NPDC051346 TaxID=3155048 RepID=UPI00343DE3E2